MLDAEGKMQKIFFYLLFIKDCDERKENRKLLHVKDSLLRFFLKISEDPRKSPSVYVVLNLPANSHGMYMCEQIKENAKPSLTYFLAVFVVKNVKGIYSKNFS